MSQTKVLMGCPLWGDEYVERFLKLCLPTMMAEKNKAALQGRCRVVLFTDVTGFHGLYNVSRDMTHAGLETTVHVIPQEIMSKVNDLPLNKYWVLGVTQQLLIQMAGRAGMGFHQLHPDHLFAEAYFENIWRIVGENHQRVAAVLEAAGKQPNPAAGAMGIVQTGISADIHACLEDLETFRQKDSSLVIPDRELGDLGWRHLHKQMRGNVMGKADLATSMPNSHYMYWVGKDKLHINCCHMNAVWIPPEATAIAPIKLYSALDTMLPMFMPPKVYMPDWEDGLTFIEVSDEKKIESAARVDFATYAATAWNQVHLSDDFTPFFEASCDVPIKDQVEYTEDAEIQKQQATVFAWLKAAKPMVKEMLEGAQKKQDELIAQRSAQPKSKRALKRQKQAKRRSNGAEHHIGAD